MQFETGGQQLVEGPMSDWMEGRTRNHLCRKHTIQEAPASLASR